MLAALYAVSFVAAFNENIVNVALIDIMDAFGVTALTAQWRVTGYMSVTTLIVTLSAFLYRRLGARLLFIVASAFLIVGFIGAMVSTTFWMLLMLRLIQSVGTGVFIPTMMSTVLAVAPRAKLGTYLCVGGMMITLGPAFGPVVSGLMVSAWGWRAIFVPTLVAILLISAVGLRYVSDPEPRSPMLLDALSVALISLGLVGLIYGLSVLMVSPLVALGFLVVAFVVLYVFVRRQFRVSSPLLDLRPMLSSDFWPATILSSSWL